MTRGWSPIRRRSPSQVGTTCTPKHTVSLGPDDYRTAITRDGIDELRDLIADFRRSPEDWDHFLQSVIDDPKIIQSVKAHKPR